MFEMKLRSSECSESEWRRRFIIITGDEIGRGDGLSENNVIEKQSPDAFPVFLTD